MCNKEHTIVKLRTQLVESDINVRRALRALRATPSDITLWDRALRVARRHGKVLIYTLAADPGPRTILNVDTNNERLAVGLGHHRWSNNLGSILGLGTHIDIVSPSQVEELTESDIDVRRAVRELRANIRDIRLWARAHRVAQRHGRVLIYIFQV